MSRPSKTEQEMGYVRDWWTEVRTIEAEYHGFVTLNVTSSPRPGVFCMEVRFTPLIEDVENPIGAHSLSFMYPNVEQSTLAGFLWRKVMALGRMVEGAKDIPRTSNNTRG